VSSANAARGEDDWLEARPRQRMLQPWCRTCGRRSIVEIESNDAVSELCRPGPAGGHGPRHVRGDRLAAVVRM